MNIVQTFWSGRKDPLVDGFGWLSPQHNLMSWALSCLSLRESYKDVVLYTDSTGYKIFHDQLKLPYTKIIVQYDNLNCHEALWAYPKLLTYSIQKKPFMHIDGDVYLPNRLPERTESGELIAQNAEIGTLYYKAMMNWIMKANIVLPEFLREELNNDSISSYNAGVIGGNDLEFIREYCQAAFDFISDNQLNDENNPIVNINYNVLFEQILFHSLSNNRGKPVSTVLDHSVNDNGYTYEEFCNFYSFGKKPLMHIIGGHKRNERVCELLERTLLNKYPDYYKRIRKLFSMEDIPWGEREKRRVHTKPLLDLLGNIQIYKNSLDAFLVQSGEIQYDELFEQEQRSCNYFRFLNGSAKEQALIAIKRNPYLSIYEVPENWGPETKRVMKCRLAGNYHFSNFDIACRLDLHGYKEIIVNDICFNILVLLNSPKQLNKLMKDIKQTFPPVIRNNPARVYEVVMTALEYLFYHKLIYID